MPRFKFPTFTLKDLARFGPLDTSPSSPNELALVMTGGGARGAYQVGLLRCLARRFPDIDIPIVTGTSAGAVNAIHLAAHHGTLQQAADELTELWCELTPDQVFRTDAPHLGWMVVRWAAQLLTGGLLSPPRAKALLDTTPLRTYLTEAMAIIEGEITGIDYNLHRGKLKAVAVSATSYTTGQNVVFVQGRDIELWERPNRKSVKTKLRVDHVMASSALPGFFPAVKIGHEYYGDGGIRMIAPLSPALHLGAGRILAVSTRYDRSREEADVGEISGYPTPARILGVLSSAIFLETLDNDARRLERMNRLIDSLPEDEREGMRTVDMTIVRPSRDLAKMARDFEPRLPKGIRFLSRGFGATRAGSPDALAMMMFQPDYTRALVELGEKDAESYLDEIADLLDVKPADEGGDEEEGSAPT